MPNIELFAFKEQSANSMAVCLKPRIPFLITHSMIGEMRKLQRSIAEEYYARPWEQTYYLFWYLHAGNISWKGIDFKSIHYMLLNNHESELEKYIEDLYEVLYVNYVGLALPLVCCSIVNRKLNGISQDFFYINRINFIKKHQKNGANYERLSELPFRKFDFNSEISGTSLPLEIYMRNDFYKVDCVDLTTMWEALNSCEHAPILEDEQKKIKLIFDEAKDSTIKRIYELASKNLNVFARIGEMQSMEHRSHTTKRSS